MKIQVLYIYLIILVLDELVDKIGTYVAILHSNDQIHGDLTTSNMMIRPKLDLNSQFKNQED